MVSLLEKVWLHRSSHRFEPELVTQEINLSHCCSVSPCVKGPLTRHCRAATQSSQPMGDEAPHKPTDGNRELSLLWPSTLTHGHRCGMEGIALTGVCQLLCHRDIPQAALGNSMSFFHTKHNRAQVLHTKGHTEKHIEKYSKLKHWNPLA